MDLGSRSLLAFGHTVRLEEFPLVLPLALALLTTLLLITLVFGRVWCGWACPQTLWADLVEGIARRLGARVRGRRIVATPAQRVGFHLVCGALGLLVGANLVWYFVPPTAYTAALLRGELPTPAVVATLAVALAVYLNLAFLRRTFCAEICPYGRFQATLVDHGTLTLRLLPDEAKRCIECGSCTRVCPTGVDIRQGNDAACINCGRCLDACTEVMRGRGETGLIGYTWGIEGLGSRALITPRTALLVAVALLAWATLFAVVGNRDPLAFSVRRSPTAMPRLLEGERFVTFFTGYVTNRRSTPATATLAARSGDSTFEVRGTGRKLVLAAGQRAAVEFAVIAPLPLEQATLPVTLTWTVDAIDAATVQVSRHATLAPPAVNGE